MTERDAIVRCPGCGNGKVVAESLGQLLDCDVCHTQFHAPEAHTPASRDDPNVHPPEDAGTASAAGAAPTRDAASAERDSASSAPRQPTPSRPTDEQGLQPAAIASETGSAVPNRNSAAVTRKTHAAEVESHGVVWNFVAMMAVAVIVTIIALGAFLIYRKLPSVADNTPSTEKPATALRSDVPWTDAATHSQRIGPVIVKVQRALYGSLRAKDLSNQVITTEDDNLLAITLSVRNRSTAERVFRNWYGHAFVDANNVEQVAELVDDQQRGYALLKFDDVSHIEGQQLMDTIRPQQTAQDTVVFLIPDETERSEIKFFRLSLPGAAVGLEETFRFQIPVRMIVGYDQDREVEPASSFSSPGSDSD